MYGIAITYGVVSLLLIGGFAYLTFKMTKKWLGKLKRIKSWLREMAITMSYKKHI